MKGWYPMKKFASLGLALVMCLALMIPAIATEETFETENSALVPTVEVEIPSSGAVILNPYGMTYTVTGTAPAGITSGTTDQIISNIFMLTNKTLGAKMEVKTKVTGVVAGNAALESANAIGNKETGNKVLLNLNYSLNNTPTKAFKPTAMSATKKTKQIKDSEQSLDTVYMGAAESGEKYTYLYFQFTGSAVQNPETPWEESDTVGATFVFTFMPSTTAATSGF